MIIGKLRQRVTFQQPAGARDAVGERQTTWTDVATVWASVQPMGARELFAADQAQSVVTHRVRTRYATELAAADASWRILFGSRVLVIDGVRNIDEAGVELEILCAEGLKTE